MARCGEAIICVLDLASVRQALKQKLQMQATMERQAQQKQAGEFLQSQIADKMARDAALQKLYTNTVKSDFFSQFETSHR